MQITQMDRHEQQNAAAKIDGYYFPQASEIATGNPERAVERSKDYCIAMLKRQIDCIAALPVDKFFELTNHKADLVNRGRESCNLEKTAA